MYRDPFTIDRTQRALDWLHRNGIATEGGNRATRFARRVAFAGWMSGHYLAHPVGREDPIGTLARLWGWQLWRRTVRRPVEVTLPNGARLVCPPWSKMAGAWVAVGLHEPGEMCFVASVLRPGETFVDVGANIGVYGVIAAKAGARVVAFEPTNGARRALEVNLARNGVDVDIRSCALGDTIGEMFLRVDLESSNHLSDTGDGFDAVRVQVSTLDEELGSETVHVLKVDAEGFDEAVLRGGAATLERCRPSVIVEVWKGALGVRAALQPYGYRFFRVAEGRLVEMPANFSGDGYLIAIAPEKVAAAERALASLPHFHAPRVRWFGSTS